jgi:hypothetical protein
MREQNMQNNVKHNAYFFSGFKALKCSNVSKATLFRHNKRKEAAASSHLEILIGIIVFFFIFVFTRFGFCFVITKPKFLFCQCNLFSF